MHETISVDDRQQKISVAEAASFLECSEERVSELMRLGELPGLKKGRAWVLPRPAFYTAVNQMAVTDAAAIRGANTPAPTPTRRGRPRGNPSSWNR